MSTIISGRKKQKKPSFSCPVPACQFQRSAMSCPSAAVVTFFQLPEGNRHVPDKIPAALHKIIGKAKAGFFRCLSLTDTVSARRHPIFFLKYPMKIADIVIADRHGDIHHIHCCRAEQICRLAQPLCLDQICISLSGSFF